MNVYHNSTFYGHDRYAKKLKPLAIQKTFFWEMQEIYIPAVYLGKSGAVLDICAKISVEAMAAFLKKWHRRQTTAESANNIKNTIITMEALDEMQAENPAHGDFAIDMYLDHTPLTRRISSSLQWYPSDILQKQSANEIWKNEKEAEQLMDAYHCDRSFCWHFGRISYDWDKPILSPQKICLQLKDHPVSLTAEHFTTNGPCDGKTITSFHPVTGQKYTLTLHGCEPMQTDFTGIGKKGILYPEYSQLLSYDISPKADRTVLDIKDCSDCDKPKSIQKKYSHADGASAVFWAGKNTDPKLRTALSSLHFKPVSEIQWRIVYFIKRREDMEISFLLPQAPP